MASSVYPTVPAPTSDRGSTTALFGDYTPAHGMAQAVTAIEVMCGLVILGFFLNAVGSMKSEIEVESELEKQRILHHESEKSKLVKNAPMVIHSLNMFLTYGYALTTPLDKRESSPKTFSPDFKITGSKTLSRQCIGHIAPARLSFGEDRPEPMARACRRLLRFCRQLSDVLLGR